MSGTERVAENEVLGAFIRSEDFISEHVEKLTAEDFIQPEARIIFEKIQELYFSGKPVNEKIIFSGLDDKEKRIIKFSYLMELGSGYVSDIYTEPHFQKLKDLSAKRKLKILMKKAELLMENKDSSEAVNLILTGIDALTEREESSFFTTMPETMERIIEEIEAGDSRQRVMTGYSNLDEHTNGLFAGDMIVIGGRPSMGKTAFSLALMDKMSKRGHKSLIFEMEMSNVKLGKRLLAQATHMDMKKFYTLKDDNEAVARVMKEVHNYEYGNKIFMDTTPSISVEGIRAKVKKYKQKYGIEVVIVDHIGLMDQPVPNNENTSLTHISKNLKSIAREFDVVMIVISQLNRGVESRQEKRPMLSDLRASGSLEQDADIVMLIYRDSYYRQADPDFVKQAVDIMEVNIAKGRDIGTTLLKFGFNEATQHIALMSYRGDE